MYTTDGNEPGSTGMALSPQAMDDVLTAVRELGMLVVGEQSMDEIYNRVAKLACGVIPGADSVSVTLLRNGRNWTAAATDALSESFDERQYQAGRGPCLHAAESGETVVIDDIDADERWPVIREHAEDTDAFSSMSVALPLHDGTAGSFNIYSAQYAAFSTDRREEAEYFADYAAAVLTNASLYDASVRLSGQLQEAMRSRAVIEQAKGIIMGERRCSADDAFAILARVSQDANRKLRDVAAALVEQARPGRD